MRAGSTGEIYLGRIVKAFGIRGELKFHPSEDFWEDVLRSKHLTLQTRSKGEVSKRSIEFLRSRPHGRNFVVAMEGVEDREAAEMLVGGELFIADDAIDVELPEEMLPFQLLGMTAKNEEGEILGEVTSVIYSSAHDVYEITGERGEFLVPAVPEFIVSIDGENRTLILRPIPGLIEE